MPSFDNKNKKPQQAARAENLKLKEQLKERERKVFAEATPTLSNSSTQYVDSSRQYAEASLQKEISMLRSQPGLSVREMKGHLLQYSKSRIGRMKSPLVVINTKSMTESEVNSYFKAAKEFPKLFVRKESNYVNQNGDVLENSIIVENFREPGNRDLSDFYDRVEKIQKSQKDK